MKPSTPSCDVFFPVVFTHLPSALGSPVHRKRTDHFSGGNTEDTLSPTLNPHGLSVRPRQRTWWVPASSACLPASRPLDPKRNKHKGKNRRSVCSPPGHGFSVSTAALLLCWKMGGWRTSRSIVDSCWMIMMKYAIHLQLTWKPQLEALI